MRAQRIVETPRMGMLPPTMAIATHSASRRGESPPRSNASSGSKILRFSQSFKGYSVVAWAASVYGEGPRCGFKRPKNKPARIGRSAERCKAVKVRQGDHQCPMKVRFV